MRNKSDSRFDSKIKIWPQDHMLSESIAKRPEVPNTKTFDYKYTLFLIIALENNLKL